jgi:hypothetical protein
MFKCGFSPYGKPLRSKIRNHVSVVGNNYTSMCTKVPVPLRKL